MQDQRRAAAEKEAASRRATDAQVLEDAERLIALWKTGTLEAADWNYAAWFEGLR